MLNMFAFRKGQGGDCQRTRRDTKPSCCGLVLLVRPPGHDLQSVIRQRPL
jgi:hypothetical protein